MPNKFLENNNFTYIINAEVCVRFYLFLFDVQWPVPMSIKLTMNENTLKYHTEQSLR